MAEMQATVIPLIAIPKHEESERKTNLNLEKGKLVAKRRNGTPEMNNNIQANITRDIERMISKKKDKDIDAKKLQNEIDQQIELSFELMEQQQTDVKEYLRRRELEEEEHSKRAANIVKRLGIGDDAEEDWKAGRGRGKSVRSFDEAGSMATTASQTEMEEIGEILKNQLKTIRLEDSKYAQTEATDRSNQETQTSDNLDEDEAASLKHRVANNELNPEDIPGVVEAVRDDLLEKVKRKIADEREKMFMIEDKVDPPGNNARLLQERPERIAKIDESFRSASEEPGVLSGAGEINDGDLNRSSGVLEEIASSLINDKINRRTTPTEVKKALHDNREELKNALLADVLHVSDIPSIPTEEQEELNIAYNDLKKAYNKLRGIAEMTKGRRRSFEEDEKVNECRTLCDDINSLQNKVNGLENALSKGVDRRDEGSIDFQNASSTDAEEENMSGRDSKELQSDLSRHANDAVSRDGERKKMQNELPVHLKNEKDMDINENSLQQVARTAGEHGAVDNGVLDSLSDRALNSQVAEYEMDNQYRMMDNANGRKHVSPGANDDLGDMLKKKIDAELQLVAKLDELKDMLSRKENEGNGVLSSLEDSKAIKMPATSQEVEMKQLKRNNEALQKNILRLSKDNLSLFEENRQLMNALPGGKAGQEGLGHFDVFGEELCIPKWETENQLRHQIDTIKDKLGEEIVGNLINKRLSSDDVIENVKVEDFLMLEDQKLDANLQERDSQLSKLSEQLIDANVANEINEMVNVSNPDTYHVIQALQNEAGRTEELLESHEEILSQVKNDLQDGIRRKNQTNKEDSRLIGERQELEKQLALVNNCICRCFPLSVGSDEIETYKEKLGDIDEEIGMLAREIEGQTETPSSGNSSSDEKTRLTELLHQLQPHVNEDLKLRLVEDGVEYCPVPDKSQVALVIKDKKEILNILGTMRRDNEGRGEGKEQPAAIEEESKRRKQGNAFEKQEYLEEMIKSRKDTLGKIEEKLAEKTPDPNDQKIDNLVNQIDLEMGRLIEELEGLEEELCESAVFTRSNAKAKIDLAVGNLQKEKERLRDILAQTGNIELVSNEEHHSKMSEFSKQFSHESDEFREKMQNCLDDTNDVIGLITDNLMQESLIDNDLNLRAIKKEIDDTKSDLKALAALEEHGAAEQKGGKAVDVRDSDIEELSFKLEALDVSQERLDKTIEEHLKNDGDPNTLEKFLKRKSVISGNISAVKDDLERKKVDLEVKLETLKKEKYEIEGESVDSKREMLLEMITEEIETQQHTDEDLDGKALKEMLKKRENTFKEFESLDRTVHDSRQNMDLISKLLHSVSMDIKERLDELDDFTTEQSDNKNVGKENVQQVLAQRRELTEALELMEDGHDMFVSSNLSLEDEDKVFQTLSYLAKKKINEIDRKVEKIEELREELEFGREEHRQNENIGQTDEFNNNGEQDPLLSEIKEELEVLKYIIQKEDIISGLTAKTKDELRKRKQDENMLKELFDKREQIVKEYLEMKGGKTIPNIIGLQIKGELEKLEAEIATHKTEGFTNNDEFPSSSLFERQKLLSALSDGAEGNEEQQLLSEIIEARDQVLRKLFELKKRESELTVKEKKDVEEVSSLQENLDGMLKMLDDELLRYTMTSSPIQGIRLKSPTFQTTMEVIASEIASLEKELEEDGI